VFLRDERGAIRLYEEGGRGGAGMEGKDTSVVVGIRHKKQKKHEEVVRK